jgi:hypothetical protein
VDESFLAWPCGGLYGDGGRVVDLTVGFPVPVEEDARPMTMAALLLTLAFGRKVDSASMGEGFGGSLDFDGV